MAMKLMLPVEPLFALGVIAVVGVAFKWGAESWQHFENYGKPKRYHVDRWDRLMMERDSRLTGNVNVQRAESVAPLAFHTNSAWELERGVV